MPDCDRDDTRPYPGGLRCEQHKPGPLPGGRYCAPARCYCGCCPSWTEHPLHVDNAERIAVDARAVASGKRRSSPQAYRAARAATRKKR